jgi:hypothetical protein
VPWRTRLFESLVVFQNYQVDAGSLTLGAATVLREFRGPVHTNFALTLVATPGPDGLRIDLLHQENRCSADHARGILGDWLAIIRGMIREPEATLAQLAEQATLPAAVLPVPAARRPDRRPVMPRTDLERRIHAVWKNAFGGEIGVEDSFFEAGGHSLLALRVLAELRNELQRPLNASDLFQFPTVAALARHLEGTPSVNLAGAAERAARARRALLRR